MIVIDCEQNSPEWLAARAGCATASCFDQILAKGKGITREKYLLRVALERFTGRAFESFTSSAMERGKEREATSIAAYEARQRVFVERVGFVRHDVLLAGASPDALVAADGLLECKCPEPLAHRDYLRLPAGVAPSAYADQIQGQLWICERSWCDFVSYCPEFGPLALVVNRIQRDPKKIDELRAEVKVFLDDVAAEVGDLQRLVPA